MLSLINKSTAIMKKKFIHRLSLLIAMIFFLPSLHAQVASTFIDINNVKAPIDANGTLFWNSFGSGQNPGYEVPKGSGRHSMLCSQLWFGGLDDGGQLHTAAQIYRQNGSNHNATDFWSGPLNLDGTAPNPADWNRIWKVNKSVIDNHRLHYKDPGYIVPQELIEWPGNGTGNLSPVLAPFVDLDGDIIYEPAEGDYPFIRGDQAVFFIVNDSYAEHTHFTGSLPFKIEVHGMVYAFNSADVILNHTVFLNYKIINRSSENYHDVYAGIWADMDLGNADDDYCATDSARRMFYVYNSDSNDGPGSNSLGYGLNPPAQGVVFLNRPLSKSMCYTSEGFPGINSYPVNAKELYRSLKGLWVDDSLLTYGGAGKGGEKSCNYIFDGDVCTGSGWTEFSVPTSPKDRRSMGSTGPLTFAPGTYFDIDVAYIFVRDTNSPNSVCALQNAADHVRSLYEDGTITSVNHQKLNRLSIFPNPMSDFTTIKFDNPRQEKFILKIMDVRGVLIKQTEATTSDELILNKADLPAGTYLISLSSDKNIFHGKLLVN
jgi:hypothetical protein